MTVTGPGADGPIVLCVLLWPHEDQADALIAYEDAVLPLVAEHGGRVVQRVRARETEEATAGDDAPLEIQILEFPSQTALEAYMVNPRRAILIRQRDVAIARTEVIRSDLV
jgi:uncharacterized protein (DUF1330 family)